MRQVDVLWPTMWRMCVRFRLWRCVERRVPFRVGFPEAGPWRHGHASERFYPLTVAGISRPFALANTLRAAQHGRNAPRFTFSRSLHITKNKFAQPPTLVARVWQVLWSPPEGSAFAVGQDELRTQQPGLSSADRDDTLDASTLLHSPCISVVMESRPLRWTCRRHFNLARRKVERRIPCAVREYPAWRSLT
jgi:hypothetical protein